MCQAAWNTRCGPLAEACPSAEATRPQRGTDSITPGRRSHRVLAMAHGAAEQRVSSTEPAPAHGKPVEPAEQADTAGVGQPRQTLEILDLEGNQLSWCVPSNLSSQLNMEYSDLGDLPY